jgi:hypothetical protein
MKTQFKIGQRVRSHDFEDKTRPGRGECYCEGVIEDVRDIDGYGDKYLITVDRRVWDGREVTPTEAETKIGVSVAHNFIEPVSDKEGGANES